MPATEFICLKCGNCCRNLIGNEDAAGLILFPDEIDLFQKRDIKPCSAIGKSLTHGSFKIITYQLTENICPHLKDNSCIIYRERPLSCKGFPFVLSGDSRQPSLLTDSECTFIKELRGKYLSRAIRDFAHCESIEARTVFLEKLRDYYILESRKIKRWLYNLRTEKWERYLYERNF